MAHHKRSDSRASIHAGKDSPDGSRPKSGMFFISRFKSRSNTTSATHKVDAEGATTSSPTSPAFGPMRRTDSAHSIPAVAMSPPGTDSTRPSSDIPPALEVNTKDLPNGTANSSAAPVAETPATAAADDENTAEPEAAATDAAAAAAPVEEDAAPAAAAPAPAVTSSPSARPTPPADAHKIVWYHEDADLFVRVHDTDGRHLAAYAVRASSLAAASRVWRRELGSANSGADSVVTWLSPADSPRALDVLFSVAHYKFRDLAAAAPPDLDALYELALATARYEAAHLLVPFARGWLTGVDAQVMGAADGSWCDEEKVLVAACVFGEPRWFAKVAARVAYRAKVDKDGVLVDSKGRPWAEQPVSLEVIDILSRTRLSALSAIISAVSEPVNRMLNPHLYPSSEQEEPYRSCLAADESAREDCEQLQLGSALMGLTKAKLWPPPPAASVSSSPEELARAFCDVRVRRYRAPGARFRPDDDDDVRRAEDDHARCGFGHRERIEEILNADAEVTPAAAAELKAKAARVGASEEEEQGLKTDPVLYKQTEVKAEEDVVEPEEKKAEEGKA